MTRQLGYKWNLRQVMAGRGMFATTDLIGPLARRRIRLSSAQVYRLAAGRPERLSLKVLMALLDILDCSPEDLIEPAAEPGTEASRKKKAAGAEAGAGELRPRRARIHAFTGRGDRGHRASRSRHVRSGRADHGPGHGNRARTRPRAGPGSGVRRRWRARQITPPRSCPGRTP